MNYLGDFSRLLFDPASSFTRVLMQQGRVQLDADLNEQSAIFWHYIRGLAEDIGGPHWGPAGWETGVGFEISHDGDDFQIGPGQYYVRGFPCHNIAPIAFNDQRGLPEDDHCAQADLESGKRYLLYLEAWERHISYIEEDGIREVALGGPDTAVRSQSTWHVKLREDWGLTAAETRDYAQFLKELHDTESWQRPRLAAMARGRAPDDDEPCPTSPEAAYRGSENQLYRLQIHSGGMAGEATFKWSRDNVVILPIKHLDGRIVTLEHLGRDDRLSVEVGNWVEVVDDDYALGCRADPLRQVEQVDPIKMQVTLSAPPTSEVGSNDDKHPQLWRWDQRFGASEEGGLELIEDGTAPVVEGTSPMAWLHLEDGVQVQFQPAADGNRQTRYRSGDYWLVPARIATGDVVWPRDGEDSVAVVPHGVDRYHAPLAIVDVQADGTPVLTDVRFKLDPPVVSPAT